MNAIELFIDPDFQSLIPPLTTEEFQQLEANLQSDGCRDPLVVWRNTLLDGHNRKEICERRNIPYRTIEIELKTRDEAKAWIIRNQFGRRNLQAFQRAELALKLEPLIREKAKENLKTPTGSRTGMTLQNSVRSSVNTQEELAKISGLSHDTIYKAKVIAERATEDVKERLRLGETSIDHEYQLLRRDEREQQREERRNENRKAVADTPRLETITAQFATIVMDPPWDFGDEGDVDPFGRARPTYLQMPIADIQNLPIASLADQDCHLYLWITNRSLPKGFALIEGWGFRYVTCLTWCKPYFGMGNYFRGQTEHVLFAVKGSQPLKRNDVGTWFHAPRRSLEQHSSKPLEFYRLVEACSPGPYLDVFGRIQRRDWTIWGAPTS